MHAKRSYKDTRYKRLYKKSKSRIKRWELYQKVRHDPAQEHIMIVNDTIEGFYDK